MIIIVILIILIITIIITIMIPLIFILMLSMCFISSLCTQIYGAVSGRSVFQFIAEVYVVHRIMAEQNINYKKYRQTQVGKYMLCSSCRFTILLAAEYSVTFHINDVLAAFLPSELL